MTQGKGCQAQAGHPAFGFLFQYGGSGFIDRRI
jgi:hypothetical protein